MYDILDQAGHDEAKLVRIRWEVRAKQADILFQREVNLGLRRDERTERLLDEEGAQFVRIRALDDEIAMKAG